MQEIIIYRADDGTDFEDETECREYEFAGNTKDCQYSLLNSCFRLLDTPFPIPTITAPTFSCQMNRLWKTCLIMSGVSII